MEEFLKITKALSDESRVKILMFLDSRELCLCQIIDMLDLSPSTVSKHVAILLGSGLVSKRKEGRWHYYSHNKKAATPEIASALRWLKRSLSDDKDIERSKKKLKGVLKKGMKELCRHYKSGNIL